MRVILQPRTLFIVLSVACLLAVWLSLALGPVSLPLMDTLRAGLRLLGTGNPKVKLAEDIEAAALVLVPSPPHPLDVESTRKKPYPWHFWRTAHWVGVAYRGLVRPFASTPPVWVWPTDNRTHPQANGEAPPTTVLVGLGAASPDEPESNRHYAELKIPPTT